MSTAWWDLSEAERQLRGAALDLGIQAAENACRPSVLYRPRLERMGELWRAVYGAPGEPSQPFGHGKTPAEAMANFDREWYGEAAISEEAERV